MPWIRLLDLPNSYQWIFQEKNSWWRLNFSDYKPLAFVPIAGGLIQQSMPCLVQEKEKSRYSSVTATDSSSQVPCPALSRLASAAPSIPRLEQKLLALCFLRLTFCFGCIPVSWTPWAHQSMDKMSSAGLKAGKKNPYTATKVDPDEDYCTPGAFELERLLWKGCPKYTHVNEVWPNLYIGDE